MVYFSWHKPRIRTTSKNGTKLYNLFIYKRTIRVTSPENVTHLRQITESPVFELVYFHDPFPVSKIENLVDNSHAQGRKPEAAICAKKSRSNASWISRCMPKRHRFKMCHTDSPSKPDKLWRENRRFIDGREKSAGCLMSCLLHIRNLLGCILIRQPFKA